MLVNKEGQTVPAAQFISRVGDDWQTNSSEDIFKDKTVILFALPGAFTPTCSSTHLPRYNELAKSFAEEGVDEIVCLSVNDTFVMNAWAQDQGAEHIRFLPDGNGEFSQKMGMLVDKADLGFGKRSWRYSMLVKNGLIEKMFIEPEIEGDPFEVSDADTMMAYIAPEKAKQKNAFIVTKPGCPYCKKAKENLLKHNIAYEEIVLTKDLSLSSLNALSGQQTVPQIFIDGQLVGGSDDLSEYLAK